MELTPEQQKAVEDIKRRQNGWPVGIPTEKNMAAFLVDNNLAEYATPFWAYPNLTGFACVRLTSKGGYYAEHPDNCDHINVVDHICQRCKQECYSPEEWDEINKQKNK